MTVVKVAVNRQFRRNKLGLKFDRQDESLPLTISNISEGGLFDETPLVQGLVVLRINDDDATWISPKKADSILHKTKRGKITVTVEGFVGKIVRESRDEKLGIILHKPKNSRDVFIWKIKEQSKFAGTDLKPGMKIITINDYQCPTSPKEAVRIMQRTIGKLKVVAVEVNRPRPQRTSHTHVRVEVNSHISTGSSNDETSQDMEDAREIVSIVPSSISSVSDISTTSSKSSLSRRVKAMFKPIMKDERSVETEAMTESSSDSTERRSRRIFRKKSRKCAIQMTMPQNETDFVSHGDILGMGDLPTENQDMIQTQEPENTRSQDLDNIGAVSSSDYIPEVEGEPYEESISGNKQVIHYRSNRITIHSEPDSSDETNVKDSRNEVSVKGLTLLSVVSVDNEETRTTSSYRNNVFVDNEETSTTSSYLNEQNSMSMVDDNATLFGEDISLPHDTTTEDGSPNDKSSPVSNDICSESSINKASSLENLAPASKMVVLPPRYPKLQQQQKDRAESPKKSDTLKASLLVIRKQGLMQDIGDKHYSQATCHSTNEDEKIEAIEGDSYDLDEDNSKKFQLDPPREHEMSESKKTTSPYKQTRSRRGVDPSDGDVGSSPRSYEKKLEPPGSRAGAIETNRKKGKDPEVLDCSQQSRHDSSIGQKPPEIIRLMKPPVRRPVRTQFRPKSDEGCDFIPQEVWDEMHSDFSSFWGRQKNYVERSWALLCGAV